MLMAWLRSYDGGEGRTWDRWQAKKCIVTVAGDTIANGQLCKKLIIAYQDNPNEKRVFAVFEKNNKIYGEFGSSTNLLIDFK